MTTAARRYGAWSGRSDGFREDVTLCIESVYASGRILIDHQCRRRRGHGLDGLYCAQHAKRHPAAAS